MKNARYVAVKVLNKVLIEGSYSNIALGHELNKGELNDLDRGLVTEIVYGTLKYLYSIDEILNKFIKSGTRGVEKTTLNILRITIYQLRYLDRIPQFAAVNEGVNLAKKMSSEGNAKLVNGVVRNYLRNSEDIFFDESVPMEELCFKYSFPRWMVQLFVEQYGMEKAEGILMGLNENPKVTVRVNDLKMSYEEAFDALEEKGYDVSEGHMCPEAIIIERGKSIENNPLFVEGAITVQDESAMLTAPLLDVDEGMMVMDVCSAPGGKTTHIAEIMRNTGRIFAFDVYEHKLQLIKENCQRMGITNVKAMMNDAVVLSPQYVGKADRVLCDVPCSGFGIIRKKPEIKWTKRPVDMNEIIQIQRRILTNSAKYLKKDGVLIYSTCTLNKAENEENIQWFLKRNPEFKVEPIYLGKSENIIYDSNGTITILPDEHMDGFFIAKLKRI